MRITLNAISIFIILQFLTTSFNAQDFQNVSIENDMIEGCGSCLFGAGVSFADFNNDGWDDLTFGTEAGRNIMFYENQGGSFEEIDAPIVNLEENHQILWVDFDNDGDKDLYVANLDAPNRLYENDGNLILTDVTDFVGLPLDNDPSYGAMFGDFNNDSHLDIYVSNRDFSNYTNRLYLSNGDGSFSEVSESSGASEGNELTFCAAFLDINGDLYPEIYTANDKILSPNSMFLNLQDETFEEISESSGTDVEIDAMNVGVGDIDNDCDLDIYVTNTNQGNKLFINNGDETFTESASQYGVEFFELTWGGSFFDCDNDLDLDLYVSAEGIGQQYKSQLYLNDYPNDTFHIANCPGMVGDTTNSHSNAYGDFNLDGLLDIAVNNSYFMGLSPAVDLWENITTSSYNWLKINLEGTESNRDGIGSWIEIYIEGNKYVRYTNCGIAYLAQNSTTEHFGLGSSTTVDSIKVLWPSGNVDIIYEIEGNQTINITENLGLVPIELIQFHAISSEAFIRIEWIVDNEINIESYTLERSLDGINFSEKITVGPNSHSTGQNKYSYNDQNVKAGTSYYYRLKVLDQEGNISFSKLIIGNVYDRDLFEFTCFPNPLYEGPINLRLYCNQKSNAVIDIFNPEGQQVFSHVIKTDTGEHNYTIETKPLDQGIYFIRISISGIQKFEKIAVI